jgi:hypothetical protein
VDGSIIAFGVGDGRIIAEHAAHSARVMSIQAHPFASQIVTGSPSGEIILWELEGASPWRRSVSGTPVSSEFTELYPPLPPGEWRDPDNEITFAPQD